jgi:hypothetical protein
LVFAAQNFQVESIAGFCLSNIPVFLIKVKWNTFIARFSPTDERQDQ